MKQLTQILFSILLFWSAGVYAAETEAKQEDPQQVVQQTTDLVLGEITSRKAELETNPTLIYPLVERTLVPRFDSERFTRSAMGRFWREASEKQRTNLIYEFKQMLMRTYALALLNYTGQTIEYLPTRHNEGDKNALVQTKFAGDNKPVPVNYRMVQNDAGKWLVYDVVIDGISLITNYRSTFNNTIREGAMQAGNAPNRISLGIDHLISTLANKNTEKNIAKKEEEKEKS